MNTGLIGKKEIRDLAYRMPVALASSFAYQKMQIKSDQYVLMMFSYHRSIASIYSMKLCVQLQDVGGSSSSSNNVEEIRNFGTVEAIPFPEIGRARSTTFNAFVTPKQNTKNHHGRPSLTTRVASSEGIVDGLTDMFDEDEIEDDSREKAEVVPETQPLYGERVLPTRAEPADTTICIKVLQGSVDSVYEYKASYKKRHVVTQPGILLIFDRHAAIKDALERDGCEWEHNVYYVRHIASNFTINFKSKEAKRHLVNAVYSKMQEQAQYYLELISSEDLATSPAMMAWIRGLELPKWLQHRNEGRRYNHMTINLSECINSTLKGTRNLPVCAIVKSTYHRLNALFVNKGR
ncbi:hypothetical protein AHAS_Ahas15G0262800 [Arachis hypogaea]